MICEFCNNVFSNQANLNNHKKNAKYCLLIQGKSKKCNFNCNGCSKTFSRQCELSRHTDTCNKNIEYKYKEKILELQEQLMKQKYEYEEFLKKQEDKYEKKISELSDKLENIAIKAVSKPTTVNNNSRINQIINNLIPITVQNITDNAQYLTLDHIKDGASGYAKYALDYPLKDKILCVDYARRKIKYKDDDGNLVDDPEMTKLCQKFFIAIESHNNNLLNSYNTSILEKMLDMNNDDNNEMTEEQSNKYMEIGNILLEEMMKVKNLKTDIEDIKKGNKPVMYHDFVKDVCSKTVC
jgi:hypothetical protein